MRKYFLEAMTFELIFEEQMVFTWTKLARREFQQKDIKHEDTKV